MRAGAPTACKAMAEFLNNEKDGGPQILECHSPILNVLEQYPIVGRFEQDMNL